jgi:hypothetical protein
MSAVVPSYKGFRYPVELISHCVWLYHRFPLSFREVEEMMLERGVVVTYEIDRFIDFSVSRAVELKWMWIEVRRARPAIIPTHRRRHWLVPVWVSSRRQ